VTATGCDKVLGINAFPDAGPIPIDAAPIRCADLQPKAPLCADFDEDPPLVFLGATPSKWSLTGTGVTAEVRDPHTGTGALWLTDNGGTYTNTYDPNHMATVVTAAFDFKVDMESALPNSTGLMRIAFDGSGHNSCYANFLLDESVPTLRVDGSCGTSDAHGEIAIPFGWVHVELTFDLTGDVTATLKVNDQTAHATFFVTTPPNLHYTVQIGLDGPTLDGLVVAYDTIVVTSQ